MLKAKVPYSKYGPSLSSESIVNTTGWRLTLDVAKAFGMCQVNMDKIRGHPKVDSGWL